jgi:hypothetical protein
MERNTDREANRQRDRHTQEGGDRDRQEERE